MGRAKTIGTATKHVLEAYVFIVLIYIVISLGVRLLFFQLNNKMSYGKGEMG
jgi:L-cystine transport system permease protein